MNGRNRGQTFVKLWPGGTDFNLKVENQGQILARTAALRRAVAPFGGLLTAGVRRK
jgi:hypothetical protein